MAEQALSWKGSEDFKSLREFESHFIRQNNMGVG